MKYLRWTCKPLEHSACFKKNIAFLKKGFFRLPRYVFIVYNLEKIPFVQLFIKQFDRLPYSLQSSAFMYNFRSNSLISENY